jgi:hypothetical protein
MSDRTTSYAKEALEAHADSALERYGMVSEEFNKAREDDPSQSVEIPLNRDQSEGVDRSEMVANDQPRPQPRPTPEMARDSERDNFDERWTDEQQRHSDHQSGDHERGDDYSR